MNPDPTPLRPVLEEIKAIIEKHDVGAMIMLVSPEYLEYFYMLTPTWSCAKMEPVPDEPNRGSFLHLQALRRNYPTAEAQQKHIEHTMGMFVSIRDQANQIYQEMDRFIKRVEAQIGSIEQTRKPVNENHSS